MKRRRNQIGNRKYHVFTVMAVAVITLFSVVLDKVVGDGSADRHQPLVSKSSYVRTDSLLMVNEVGGQTSWGSEPCLVLHRVGYEAGYSSVRRIPRWVAWSLTASHTRGAFSRKGIDFQEDVDVPEPRATDRDYYRSGYDRGHMCPSADNRWSEEAQRQSFLFTNICPQAQGLNAGDWNEMEQQCRIWARQYGTLYIVCGPILYKGRHKTIGKNRVTVPEAFYKVILRITPNPHAIGFVCKNKGGNHPKGDYVSTVDEVERITGLDFFAALPDDIEQRVETSADLCAW